MVDRKQRPLDLADQVGRKDGARFLGAGKPQRFGEAGTEYEPLLVRKSDKERSLRLLTVLEESTSDVGLLLDVVLAQGRLLAEQSLELDRLRTDLESLRAERVTTEVTKQVHEALLKAGAEGVGIEGFKFEVSTAQSLAERRESSVRKGDDGSSEAARSWSATADIGAVLDILKGAHLAGEDVNATLMRVHSLLDTRTRTNRFATHETTGTLQVERIAPRRQ